MDRGHVLIGNAVEKKRIERVDEKPVSM